MNGKEEFYNIKRSDKELDIELLKLYFEEWKYRHENLWKRMITFIVVIFLYQHFL